MLALLQEFMSEPILSPDGNFVWDGSKWVPHTSNQQSMQMQDSVVSGDIVSSTTIHRSDADVIKAAMDGVVASIKEMNTIQNTAQQPSTTYQQPLQPPPLQPMQQKKNLLVVTKTQKKSLVPLVIVLSLSFVLIGGSIIYFLLKDEDLTYPFEDNWVNGKEDIQFNFKEDNTLDVYDENGLFIWSGNWNVTKTFEDDLTSGVIFISFQNPDNPNDVEEASYYYHVSKNVLVLHGVNDNGNGCDPWVRGSFGGTEDMRRGEVEKAEPPDFCTLRDVE